ncbi:MAG: hypothetical protein JWM11_3615 [Planctomycetaceae bacterium]|nr:hypothetical protein [Planctomycetaceae bacterium]
MLTLWGTRRGVNSDGTSRRDFLQVGALGATGVALPDLLRARTVAAAESPGKSISQKSVIWLWLSGGPSQLETFDPKPNNPVEFRSVVGSVATNVPGIEIGGLFPQVARHADKLAIVRSLSHRQADHAAASHWMMTGHDYPPAANGAAPISPSLGSMQARYRGATNPKTGLPNYVTTDHLYADKPVWLGAAYTPFHVRDEGVGNMFPRLTQDRLTDRRALLQSFDTLDRRIDRNGMLAGMDSFEQQAFELIRSRSPVAFDINREDPKLRDRYGVGLGQNLLLARRLCEAGVGFINVWYGGWDSHGTNPSVGHGTIEQEMHKLAPKFDRAVSALLEDIAARGLEDQVLVVIAAEFGRTPWLDAKSGGRDHWPQLCPLVFAGGGLKMGQVVGQSSARADVPKSSPYSPQDMMATVFHVLDMPLDLSYTNPNGRPVSMLEQGRPITELI